MDERFEMYIELLRKDQTINVDPMMYTDFLIYLRHLGLQGEFKDIRREDIETGDEAFPILYAVTIR